jgi:hypothetical protein
MRRPRRRFDPQSGSPDDPCWLPCASGRERSGSKSPPNARPATRSCVPSVDAVAKCFSNPDLGPGSHGAGVVAAGATQAGQRARCTVDMVRSRRELVLENAVLRHQVNVLRRGSKRPKLHLVDRLKLLSARSCCRRDVARSPSSTGDHSALASCRLPPVLAPTISPRKTSPLPDETIDLIRDMAARGRLWGAERIRGELLKVGIKVNKRTIQKYMRGARSRGGGGQSWATFLKNHAERMWACDFIQTHDILFRQVYAFFIVHLGSRRVVHIAATRTQRRRGLHSSCATPRWTGMRRPCCCGIATTSSDRRSTAWRKASARR